MASPHLLPCFFLSLSLSLSSSFLTPSDGSLPPFPSASASSLDGSDAAALVSCVQASSKGTALERWMDCVELHAVAPLESHGGSHGSGSAGEPDPAVVGEGFPELAKAFPATAAPAPEPEAVEEEEELPAPAKASAAVAPAEQHEASMGEGELAELAKDFMAGGEGSQSEDINSDSDHGGLELRPFGIDYKCRHSNCHLERNTACIEVAPMLDVVSGYGIIVGDPVVNEAQKASVSENEIIIHEFVGSGISAVYLEQEFQNEEATATVQSSQEFNELEPWVEGKDDDGSSLLYKLNVSTLILCAFFFLSKLGMTWKRPIEASYNSEIESNNMTSDQHPIHSEINAHIDTQMFEVLGPPLGRAIGAVFAEVLIHRDCSMDLCISADELELLLKIAITESLMPVFGIECLKLVEKVRGAFQSTYRTIGGLREVRQKGSQKSVDKTLKKGTAGGLVGCAVQTHSCTPKQLRDPHMYETTDYADFKAHQQEQEGLEKQHTGISNENSVGKSSEEATGNVQCCFCNLIVNHVNRSRINFKCSNSCRLSASCAFSEALQEQVLCPDNLNAAQNSSYINNGSQFDNCSTQNNCRKYKDASILEQELESTPCGSCLIATDQCHGTQNSFKDDVSVLGEHNFSCINSLTGDNCISNETRHASSPGSSDCCINHHQKQLKENLGSRMSLDHVNKEENISISSIKNLKGMQNAIVCAESRHAYELSAERGWKEILLQTFEKLVQAQERHNYIKSIELSQRIKHLGLSEEQILLVQESNELMKQKLIFSQDKEDIKKGKEHEKKIVAAQLELSRTCADELIAGLSIMLLSLGYGVRRYSFVLLSNLISTCQPALKESRQSSWIHIDWLYNSLDAVTSSFQAFICQVTVAGRLLVGFAFAALLTSALVRRSAIGSSQAMPATIIVVVLGGICGFAGKISVDSLGGDGYYWLVIWEVLCSLHAFVACFTPVVFRLLNGSPLQKERCIFLPPWLRRLAFHLTIAAILPVLAGQLPFVPFRDFAKNVLSFLINDVISPVMLYSRGLVGKIM